MPQRWLDNWILNLVAKQIFITRAMIDNDAKVFLQIDGVHYGQAVFFLSYYNQASNCSPNATTMA